MNYLLVAAALLPAFVLCVYVYKKDRIEKEPIGLLLGLLAAGAACCIPAAFAEGVLLDTIDSFFNVQTAPDGNTYVPSSVYYVYYLVRNFIGIALVEEFFKWIVLIKITKKNKNHNSFFDGMIYAIFVSLGFAAFENIFYVLKYGWYVAVVRAILAVPGHMFDSVLMGYHYSHWNILDKAADIEKDLVAEGRISYAANPITSKKSRFNSLLVPVLAHGFYDFCCTVGGSLAMLVLVGFVIFLYIHCFKKIKQMSKADGSDNAYAMYLIRKKYPNAFAE